MRGSTIIPNVPNGESSSALFRLPSPSRCFAILCTLHFTVWFLAPTLIFHNPPTDSLEGIAWGNLWQLGYPKHPFLAPWLTAGATHLFGVVGWPIYLLSQIAVIVCFWALWRLALKFVSPWQALITVFLLEGVTYYGLQSSIFNPNILMLPFWALCSLSFYNAIKEDKLRDWILLGLFSGLAMLAKYESAILLILFIAILIVTTEGRKSFRNTRLYLAGFISFLVFLPNFYWLSLNHFDAISYAVGEMTKTPTHSFKFWAWLFHPLNFTLEQLGVIAPALLLYFPFYKTYKQHKKCQEETLLKGEKIDDFDWKFLTILSIGPLVFTLLFSLLTNAHLVSRWAYPFFTITPLLWVVWLKPEITPQKIKYFFIALAVFTLLLVSGQFYSFHIRPFYTHSAPHSASFPGKKVTALLTKEWHQAYHSRLPFIAGSSHNIIVNIAAFSPDEPVPYFDWSTRTSPWIQDKTVRQDGAVFVLWPMPAHSKQFIQNLRNRYPHLQKGHVFKIPRQTGAKVPPILFWAALLPPQR